MKLGHVLADLVAKRELALDLGIGRERRREGFADRAELEQRIARDGGLGVLLGHAIVDEEALAVHGHGDGHPRNVVLGDHRLHRLIDELPYLGVLIGGTSARQAARRAGEDDGSDGEAKPAAHDLLPLDRTIAGL